MNSGSIVNSVGALIGPLSARPFRQIWCVDFEFQTPPGENPTPICMVAHEYTTRQRIRLWRDDLVKLPQAPFDTGEDTLFVAYMASAELGCFLELGWEMSTHVLDLYAEHRLATNGLKHKAGNSLLGALACNGLAHIDAGEKEAMRRLILDHSSWSDFEAAQIMDYCESDVIGLNSLLPVMEKELDLPRALLRGRYMIAVAKMERQGVPVDRDLILRLTAHWTELKFKLIEKVDLSYGLYDGSVFKRKRFEVWLSERAISWPRLPSGALAMDEDTFKAQANMWPELQQLHELRKTIRQMGVIGLGVGSDGFARTGTRPFSSVTGRNQPSTNGFVFGLAKWARGLIQPKEGWGLAYIDFKAQEIGIAAALSGDAHMVDGYTDGDPYLAFAKAASLAPPEANKETHKEIRDRCKEFVLGLNYGMGEDLLAKRAGISRAGARELTRLHQAAYPQYYRWRDNVVDRASISRRIETVFGWQLLVDQDTKATTLLNFPMQANGAEMMRLAAIVATELGIRVCAPIHDAFVITAPLDRLDEEIRLMQEIMAEAGRVVTGGLRISTDVKIVRWPDRYGEDRGSEMWKIVIGLLDELEDRQHD